jgi:serine/threonine-protein kinase RsbW
VTFVAHQIDAGVDSSALDENVASLLARHAAWLPLDDALKVRLGLHELVVNIRRHAYGGEPGPINVHVSASSEFVTIVVRDWGAGLPDVERRVLPTVSGAGGYGIGIIDRVFSEVTYQRHEERNEWLLSVHAIDVAAQHREQP